MSPRRGSSCGPGAMGAFAAILTTALVAGSPARAATPFVWKGRTWNVTSGGMAGVADGSPANVSIDGSGYLHLAITNTNGTWTASELFTTDPLGFGTYQWQVDGPIDVYDKNVVLGLFPYGPAGGIGKDGTNEIDIEFSRWGQAGGPNADWTDYPSTGTVKGETSFSFSLSGGTLSTSRFVWKSTSIEDFLMTGLQPVGSTAGLVKSWTYAPANPTTNIPQQPMPLGINLWCFAIPSDGKNEAVVIRDFEFVPEGSPILDAGAESEAGSSSDAGAGAESGADAGAGADSGAGADAGAGAGADAGAGAGAGASVGAEPAGAADSAPSSAGGCSCSVGRTDRPWGGWLLLAGAVVMLGWRRRGARATASRDL